MATARPLHEFALWEIIIAPGGSVSPGNQFLKIAASDTIYFKNTAGFPVNIAFTNSLANISNLPQGATSSAEGAVNVTVNYTIYNANTNQPVAGPFAVQFGIGPLPVSIATLNTSPDPIAVPAGGQIAFHSDVKYNIGWIMNGAPAHVWAPQPGTVSSGPNGAQTAMAGANGQTLTYTLVSAAAIRGGGTVKVGT
jgi:hypothetical protein